MAPLMIIEVCLYNVMAVIVLSLQTRAGRHELDDVKENVEGIA